MTTDTLEVPPLIAPAAAPSAVVVHDIKATVLAQFRANETALKSLAAKYANVAFNVTTTKGMDEAKAARLDLRENGRFLIQRAETRIKSEVNALKTTMSEEVERLVAIVKPVEEAVHAQIVAEEERKAAEKAERERIAAEAAQAEAARKQRLEDGIATLAGYVTKAQGKSAADIDRGLNFVRGITIAPVLWQEYAQRAADTLADTIGKLEALRTAAVQAEKDAAELAALRAEKEARDRAEREAAAAEAARQAEARRLDAEQQRQREEAEAAAQRQAEEAARVATAAAAVVETTVGMALQQAYDLDLQALAEPEQAQEEPQASIPAVAEEPATLKLGDIRDRLQFALTESFITEVIGVPLRQVDGRAKLWRESDWPAIKRGLIAHIQAL